MCIGRNNVCVISKLIVIQRGNKECRNGGKFTLCPCVFFTDNHIYNCQLILSVKDCTWQAVEVKICVNTCYSCDAVNKAAIISVCGK